jgi:hypothetical protein
MVFHFILVPFLTKVVSYIQTILTYLPTLYQPSALATHIKTSMISSSVIEGTLICLFKMLTLFVQHFYHNTQLVSSGYHDKKKMIMFSTGQCPHAKALPYT